MLIGTYKAVADLLRQALAARLSDGVEVAHFGAIRGLDRWKDFDSVIVAGREQMPPREAEAIARCLFGDDPEPLLLTGEYVPQMRGHRLKDGTRSAVEVQVHPDPRVQAIVEQTREREIEQMVGRLRLVHRARPARVFLLTNLPTALAVDRLAPWEDVVTPDKMERAVLRGAGVLPLSAAELARAHPELWGTANQVDLWRKRKGGQVPIEYSYWKVTTLSAVTRVRYRRPGEKRGDWHQALIPGDVYCPDAARLDLEPIVGPLAALEIEAVLLRPESGQGRAAPPPATLPPERDVAEGCTEPPPEPTNVHDHPLCWDVLTPPFAEPAPPAAPPLVVPFLRPALAPCYVQGVFAIAGRRILDELPRPAPRPRAPWRGAMPRRSVGNLPLAVAEPEPSPACPPWRRRPAVPANGNAPAWDDDQAWSPRFLQRTSREDRLHLLADWIAAAGGRLVAEGAEVRAELPKLPPGLGRAELLRRCRELRVTVREAYR